jgi:hypothetical protein
MTLRLGKKPAVHDERTLRFERYAQNLGAPPAAVDYGKAVRTWPMYLNDKYADCTAAAAGHLVQTWTANAGGERLPSEAEVLKFYEHFTTPGPENACALLDVLKYWRTADFAGERITAFATLKLQNAIELKHAVHLFGGCFLGLVLPKFIMDAKDGTDVAWTRHPDGARGEGARAPNGGHCVAVVGYDDYGARVVTWGRARSMTWDFYSTYADEAYAVLSPHFLDHGKTPAGLDLTQLKHDVEAVAKVPPVAGT